MFAHGTTDARGYRQWQQVGRYVKKGAKAFHILVPIFKKVPVKNKDVAKRIKELRAEHCGKCEEAGVKHCGECWVADEILELKEREVIHVEKLVGFKPVPVFRKEDTEGEPLEEDLLQEQLTIPCTFQPLLEELKLNVKAVPFDGRYYGWYSPHRKEIALASPEVQVFLHELCHAADDVLHNLTGSHEEREVVAELSAAVVAYLLGYRFNLKHTKAYLSSFPATTIYKVIGRVERVVNFIVERTRTDNLLETKNSQATVSRKVVA